MIRPYFLYYVWQTCCGCTIFFSNFYLSKKTTSLLSNNLFNLFEQNVANAKIVYSEFYSLSRQWIRVYASTHIRRKIVQLYVLFESNIQNWLDSPRFCLRNNWIFFGSSSYELGNVEKETDNKRFWIGFRRLGECGGNLTGAIMWDEGDGMKRIVDFGFLSILVNTSIHFQFFYDLKGKKASPTPKKECQRGVANLECVLKASPNTFFITKCQKTTICI